MKTQLSAVFAAFTMACGGSNPTAVGPVPDAGPVAVLDAGTPKDAGVPDAGPVTFTVSGTLVGLRGIPAASVTVSIGGKSPLNTDTAGHFTFSGVTAPYDAVVVDNPNHTAIVYQGLTRPDPTLFYGGYNAGPLHTATLNGQISQIDPNPASNETTLVCLVAPEVHRRAWTDSAGNFGFTTGWNGGQSISGTFFSLQYTRANGLVTAFKGYSSKEVTLSADGSFNESMSMVPVTNGSISGTVATAPGYSVTSTFTVLTVHGLPAVAFNDNSGSTAFTYVTPEVPGLKFMLEADATRAGYGTSWAYKTGLDAHATNVAIQVPAAPEFIVPSDGATQVDTQMKFSWTPFSSGVHFAVFEARSSTDPTFIVVTAATSATIPDLQALGMGLPAASAYRWYVEGVAPFASVDALATDDIGRLLSGVTTHDVSMGVTEARNFGTR